VEKYLNKHAAVIQILGGVLATAVTLTAFAYTNFQTKEETKDALAQIEKHQELILRQIDKRLERIENKLDKN
jgi:multidrug efflux pump subunit AcrB